jgi:hypothetical protein
VCLRPELYRLWLPQTIKRLVRHGLTLLELRRNRSGRRELLVGLSGRKLLVGLGGRKLLIGLGRLRELRQLRESGIRRLTRAVVLRSLSVLTEWTVGLRLAETRRRRIEVVIGGSSRGTWRERRQLSPLGKLNRAVIIGRCLQVFRFAGPLVIIETFFPKSHFDSAGAVVSF